ncbi:MAG: hypothetical protein JXK94_08200 [Deltaproteobacteria bacterium]|nr:hypothetical protein [Deltaproteobacteria bacterium]
MTQGKKAIFIRQGRPEDVNNLVALLYQLFSLEADFNFQLITIWICEL